MNIRKSKNRVFDLMPKFYDKSELQIIFKDILSGNYQGIQDLVYKYEPLVTFIIERFFFEEELDNEELYQEGLIGLGKAIINFNMNSGVSFEYYLFRCIKNEISRYVDTENKRILNEENGLCDLVGYVSSEEVFLNNEDYLLLYETLKVLPLKKREIVKLKYGIIDIELLENPCILETLSKSEIKKIMEKGKIDRPYKLREIAKIYNISNNAVEKNIQSSLEIMNLYFKGQTENTRVKITPTKRK